MRIFEANFLEDHSEDLYGLWEVRWYLDVKNVHTIDEQIIFLIDLVERRLVDVFIAYDPSNHGEALSRTPALDKVNDLGYWNAPEQGFRGPLCYISASQNGSSLQNA
ncbi:hypothetical protein [Sphingomonas psychrotolerans]|uniref:hypothetical protein n=1 Tax=Sphingomonas psychrotolerans TaxID=1327635 RepID=UPI001F1CA976|nr:hypothetical protein [Sphingomonas psychrotolerans]